MTGCAHRFVIAAPSAPNGAMSTVLTHVNGSGDRTADQRNAQVANPAQNMKQISPTGAAISGPPSAATTLRLPEVLAI